MQRNFSLEATGAFPSFFNGCGRFAAPRLRLSKVSSACASESSLEDLAAIVRFIALREGPDMARQIGFGIYDRAQVLTRHPETGSMLAEKQDTRWKPVARGRLRCTFNLQPVP